MKKLLATTAVLATLVAGNAHAALTWKAKELAKCHVAVTDLRDLQVNVRTFPDSGVILGTLDNGDAVRVYDNTPDQKWAFISGNDEETSVSGWVFRKYLGDCKPAFTG
jgi:hypothetical protein